MAGIYIHIPFCKQACHYCNFYFSLSLTQKETFLAALVKEIELTKNYLAGEPIETLYFGGGTPSLLSLAGFTSILQALQSHYDLSHLQEFTIEANPDDLSTKKISELRQLRAFGFNRFSIGIQSFFDDDLCYMNRAHNAQEALASIKRVQDAGFDNITIDLIYGTPTMNDEAWMKNLLTAFSLNVPHISSYALTVEPKTTLEHNIRKKKIHPVDEEQSARQLEILMNEMKKAGYEQYEISNFAKPGKYAVHNTNYWRGKKYLGLGPSAHSFNNVSRRWNVSNLHSYIQSIQQGKLLFEEETLTPAQLINERIMTSLRTQWGLDVAGLEFSVSSLIKESLQSVDATHYTLTKNILTLTDRGKLFADSIAASLFIDEEQIS